MAQITGSTQKGAEVVFGKGGFKIREGRRITKISVIQGADLVVEQKDRRGNTIYLSHYSNPGLAFFGSLLKFLYVHRIPIPKLPKAGATKHPTDEMSGIGLAKIMARQPFPLSYQYAREGARVAVQPMYSRSKPPELDFIMDKERITITPAVAQALIQTIPKLYPNYSYFHKMTSEFQREAPKYHNQQIPKRRRISPFTGKQLEFKFMKKSANQKRVTKPKSK